MTGGASADLRDDESTLAAPPPQLQPVSASRSPVSTIHHHLLSFLIIFSLRQPSETGKQPRSSNKPVLPPGHFQKSSQSRSRDIQQHVKLSGGDSSQAINESNRATLALLAEVYELKRQNSVLVRENKLLEAENKRLGSENKRLESENKSLESENKHLASEVKAASVRRFQCQICLEEHKEAMVVHIDSCGHCYCRECITSYVGNKLDAKRFPILCPVCAAESRKDKPGGV
jgi:hypothetical protein